MSRDIQRDLNIKQINLNEEILAIKERFSKIKDQNNLRSLFKDLAEENQ